MFIYEFTIARVLAIRAHDGALGRENFVRAYQ